MIQRSRNKLGAQGQGCDCKGRPGWEGICVSSQRAAVNKVPKHGGLKPQFWKLEVKIKASIGRAASSWVLWGTLLFCASLLSSDGLPAVFGVPWHVDISPWYLPSCSHGVLVCGSVSVSKFPVFIRTQCYWIRAHPNDLILTWLSAKTPFPNKVTFIITGI